MQRDFFATATMKQLFDYCLRIIRVENYDLLESVCPFPLLERRVPSKHPPSLEGPCAVPTQPEQAMSGGGEAYMCIEKGRRRRI